MAHRDYSKGPAEHSVTFGKSMWGSMATLVGGNNISASSVEFYGSINPEKVLAAKPDVIVITGRETELKKSPTAIDLFPQQAVEKLYFRFHATGISIFK